MRVDAFAKKFRLRVLTELDSLSSDDVCLGQELVRKELSGSHSDSKCGASSGCCGDSDQFPHVTNSPLGRRCIQVFHVENDLRFLWGSFCRWRHRIHAGGTAPRPGDT